MWWTTGSIPYFSLDYNIAYVASSFEPGHVEDHIDDNFTRHTRMVAAKDWKLHQELRKKEEAHASRSKIVIFFRDLRTIFGGYPLIHIQVH